MPKASEVPWVVPSMGVDGKERKLINIGSMANEIGQSIRAVSPTVRIHFHEVLGARADSDSALPREGPPVLQSV